MKKLTKKKVAGAAAAIATAASVMTYRIQAPVPDFVDPFYAGAPLTTNTLVMLTNRTYVVGYDPDTMNPAWVAYQLYWAGGVSGPKRPSKFRSDRRLGPVAIRHKDYTRTGFNRGHMAPSYGIGVCYGKGGQKETFLMSNVIPQTPGLNQGPWRILEEDIAKKWTQDGNVWVITGPIYTEYFQTIPPGVRVPESCFKVLLRHSDTNGPPQAIAFIMPQRVLHKDSYKQFVTSVDEVERITGIDFFAELPDETEREMEAAAVIWR